MTAVEASTAVYAFGPAPRANRRCGYSCERAAEIAAHFQLPVLARVQEFAERGNIHEHTFLVSAGTDAYPREYLLQRINDDVFRAPRKVMAAMTACIGAQAEYVARHPLARDTGWEVVRLVPTRCGGMHLEVPEVHGLTYWRMMERIRDARTYKSLGEIADPLERLRVAEEAGRGLALFGDLTSGLDASRLEQPLPGYRDTRFYFDQLRSVLSGSRTAAEAEPFLPRDPEIREATLPRFLIHLPPDEFRRRLRDRRVRRCLELAEAESGFAMTLLDALASGELRTVAIHGDTKLDNFLFSARTGRVKALVDLDTIMPHTWLVDWGDMVRSLVNVAGEKESNLRRVRVDMPVFEAITRGFLATAREVTEHEVGLMVPAVQIIALELGIRFLTDYLRGDTYFRLCPGDPPDLNRTRALAQLTLFQRLRGCEAEMRCRVAEERAGRRVVERLAA